MNNIMFRDIVYRRVTTATMGCVALQTLCLLVVTALGNLNVQDPLLSIWDIPKKVFSLYTIVYLVIMVPFIFILVVLRSRFYMSKPQIFESRFHRICSAFFPRNIIIAILYMFAGTVFMYVYSTVTQFSSTDCNYSNDRLCLIEQNTVYLLSGLYFGLYHYAVEYYFGKKYLNFPVIELPKFITIRMNLIPNLKASAMFALKLTFVLFGLYYWKGILIQSMLCDLLGLEYDCPYTDGLMNFTTVYRVWLMATAFLYTVSSVDLLVAVCLREHFKFPIILPIGISNLLTLHSVLAMTNVPLAEHLGYLDLKILSEKDKARRKDIFSLSQPGGHPHHWNRTVSICLKLIMDFTSQLLPACEPTFSVTKVPESSKYHLSQGASFNVTHKPNISLRNMSMSRIEPYYDYEPNIPNELVTVPLDSLLVGARNKLCRAINIVYEKLGVSYIFSKCPNSKIGHILIQSQVVIWAVDSLSMLISASFIEDKFGVVQNDIPAIMSAFLSLKRALDKVPKFPAYKKLSQAEKLQVGMKKALTYSIKRSFFCVCNTFGIYANEFPFSSDVKRELEIYMHRDS